MVCWTWPVTAHAEPFNRNCLMLHVTNLLLTHADKNRSQCLLPWTCPQLLIQQIVTLSFSDWILLLESLAKLLLGLPHTCLYTQSQSVSIDDFTSIPLPLEYSVYRILFWFCVLLILCTHNLSVSSVICNHGCVHHKYADDTQIKISKLNLCEGGSLIQLRSSTVIFS